MRTKEEIKKRLRKEMSLQDTNGYNSARYVWITALTWVLEPTESNMKCIRLPIPWKSPKKRTRAENDFRKKQMSGICNCKKCKILK